MRQGLKGEGGGDAVLGQAAADGALVRLVIDQCAAFHAHCDVKLNGGRRGRLLEQVSHSDVPHACLQLTRRNHDTTLHDIPCARVRVRGAEGVRDDGQGIELNEYGELAVVAFGCDCDEEEGGGGEGVRPAAGMRWLI